MNEEKQEVATLTAMNKPPLTDEEAKGLLDREEKRQTEATIPVELFIWALRRCR